MANIINHNPIMSEIKTSLNHILHSLTELSTKINKPQHAPYVQLINTPSPVSLPLPSNPTPPSSTFPLKPILPSSYPIKRLTYLEMQQLRDQGLCVNCNDMDTTSHRCPVKRIVLVLPDEDLNIEQLSMEIHASTIPEQPSSQDISLLALNHDSDPKAMRLELQELADLNATQFQSVALNSSVARQMDMSITHHSVHTKMAHILDFLIDKSSSLSAAARNGNSIMSNGLYSDNYLNFLMGLDGNEASPVVHMLIAYTIDMMRSCCLMSMIDWIVGKMMMGESKVFIFDPGGIFDMMSIFKMRFMYGDDYLTTLRTRSISRGW